MIGLGTIINSVAIIAGGLIGHFSGKLFKEENQDSLTKVCGISVLFIAISGAMQGMLNIDSGKILSRKAMLIVLTLSIGTIIGELCGIERGFEHFGGWLKIKTGNGNDNQFVNAFVTASLTVCIGAMAIVGVLPKRNLDKNNKANKVYNTQWGAHLMAERKRYSAEEKSAIVLEILQDGKKISDVAEEHGIHPNQIMLWKKQALENMAELFKTERKDITAKKEQREISELKSQIAHKDSVIAELADENMSLKKKSFGLRLTK